MSDLPAFTLIGFLVGDFEAAWDSLAANDGPAHRGNFMFAMQAMVLLELACRVCANDQSGNSIVRLSAELHHRESRYFAILPGKVPLPKAFRLPSRSETPERELLPAIFDLVRHGHVHQYEQMRAKLADGTEFGVSIAGAELGRYLKTTFASGRPVGHLQSAGGADLWLRFRPDVFFLDLRDSIYGAGLVERDTELKRLTGPTYPFSRPALADALQRAGVSHLGPG